MNCNRCSSLCKETEDKAREEEARARKAADLQMAWEEARKAAGLPLGYSEQQMHASRVQKAIYLQFVACIMYTLNMPCRCSIPSSNVSFVARRGPWAWNVLDVGRTVVVVIFEIKKIIVAALPFHDCVNGIGHHKVHTMLGLFNAYQISEIMR